MEYNPNYNSSNNSQYDYSSYDNYGNDPYGPPPEDKSIKGLKIMIVILALILAGLSVMYFTQVRNMKADFAEKRDTLISQLTSLSEDYTNLRTENDTISLHLETERGRTDSLLQAIQKERSISRSKIKGYEKQLSYMRTVMEGYIKQIDSLNTINQKLGSENVTLRKQVTSARLRADKAEEQASELTTKVQKGAVIRARNIALLALNNSDKVVTRANRAARLRVDCVLVGNELSTPGPRNVYVQITGPDNYVLANSGSDLFNYEGDMITYSAVREVDYQNEDLNVSLYYNGGGIREGKYAVRIFVDGHLIGSNEILLR